jgi:apolipoprotein D and lipocalin family protein
MRVGSGNKSERKIEIKFPYFYTVKKPAMKKLLLSIFVMTAIITGCEAQKSKMDIDKTTVKHVDINRYLGTWYEIARFDHSFERGLVGVTATYSLRPDGKIRVLNQGYKNSFDGKHKRAVGKAKIPDPANTAHLKVSFFLNFYADYLVLELDEEGYQYAMIGSSGDRFLWILSRTPQMDPEIYQRLIGNAKTRGYAVDDLIKVSQR